MKNGGLAEPLQGRGSDPRPGKGPLDLAFRVSDPDRDRASRKPWGQSAGPPGQQRQPRRERRGKGAVNGTGGHRAYAGSFRL